ncbi:type IV toxin-antitoxin system AbiEi family antitoxin [Demequina sp. SYSU T00192]|uniref:Type IV toxin-antitoxin system AbiEi family antitoxin n=1 Tax=Demequina litoralis TaxID=3051660 RepID=A0ABT8GA83_9MICO|nr:type IV toxin-antitoxin system AbiEi family antitoxin [Demequina sp. SYSU T00192]MDN4476043.1 type IV toxin-antitoxin system AbiEi family antitoxin [Demequina sp. SYSU T00192]
MRDDEGWAELCGVEVFSVPPAYPLFATADLRGLLGDPDRRLRALRADGRIVTIARGVHVVVPDGADRSWLPGAEEVGWRVAAARFGLDVPYVSGLTAASLHGATARSSALVHVTVPRQVRARRLDALGTLLEFHTRDERVLGNPLWHLRRRDERTYGLDVIGMVGELGIFRVASPVQTVLDLLHSPWRSGSPDRAREAVGRLLRGIADAEIDPVARGQRRHSAAERIRFQRLGRWVRDPDLRA